jgi:Domain of unknown function (DUF1726)
MSQHAPQDFEALTPNLLARTIETVEGGGIVVLLLSSMDSLTRLYTLAMDVHSRLRTESHQQVTGESRRGIARARVGGPSWGALRRVLGFGFWVRGALRRVSAATAIDRRVWRQRCQAEQRKGALMHVGQGSGRDLRRFRIPPNLRGWEPHVCACLRAGACVGVCATMKMLSLDCNYLAGWLSSTWLCRYKAAGCIAGVSPTGAHVQNGGPLRPYIESLIHHSLPCCSPFFLPAPSLCQAASTSGWCCRWPPTATAF